MRWLLFRKTLQEEDVAIIGLDSKELEAVKASRTHRLDRTTPGWFHLVPEATQRIDILPQYGRTLLDRHHTPADVL